jgi:hypothetical protein
MKHLLNYGIWIGAIASYILIFMYPAHVYVPYAKKIILIYEIFCWVLFGILSLSTLIFTFAKLRSAELIKTGTPEQFKKLLVDIQRKKLHQHIVQYIHYIFIIFVGVFVGDMSMTFILTLNSILYIILTSLLKSVIAEAANE